MQMFGKKNHTPSPSGNEEGYLTDPVNALYLKLPQAAKYSGVVLQFTSLLEDEGVSDIVDALANLIATHKKRRVLVVDGITHYGVATLSDLVGDGHDIADHVRPTSKPLVFKAHLARELEDLVSEDLARAFGMLAQDFAYILIKTPALAAVPTSPCTDGTVIVIEAGRNRWQLVQELAQDISAAGGQIAGAVMTKERNYMPRFLRKI